LDFAQVPIVGREEIQERIRQGLGSALAGHGQTLLLVGEIGLGKSRLCRWVREEGEGMGFRVATARAYQAESGLPYSLISDAFLPLLRDLPAETLDALSRGRVQELESLLPGLAAASGPFPPAEAASSAESRVRSLWTFSEVLERLAGRAPLLVILEDLQWAEPSSLELVHFLARYQENRPILMVFTRDELPPGVDSPLLEMERSLVGRGLAERIVFSPLTRRQTGALLRMAFGLEEEAAAEFIDHLHQWSQGNLFFLEKTLEGMVSSGRLYRKGSSWLGWEVRDFELPLTVREVVLARLAHLSPGARMLAEFAAILGSRAPFRLLRVLSSLPEAELLEALQGLVAGGILKETMQGEGVVYEFRQTITRETVVGELGLARAQILHGQVARGLQEHFDARTGDYVEVLAYHELHAGDQGTPQATQHLVLAGRNALRRFGNAEASRYFAAALSLMERNEADSTAPPTVEGGRPGVLRELAATLTDQGRYEEAVMRWEEARHLAMDAGAVEDAAECRRRIGMIRISQGRPGVGLKEFDTILALHPHGLPPALRAMTHLHRGVALEQLGRPREAREELEGVLGNPESQEDPAILAEAHRVLFNLHMWEGDRDGVQHHARHALEQARLAGERTVAFWTYWGHAAFEGLMGNLATMTELVQEADRVAREVRSPLLELRGAEVAIELASATGEWDKGITLGEQAIALARALNQQTVLARVLVWTAVIYLDRGEGDLARPLLREAWELAAAGEEDTLNVHGALPAHIGRARLALAEGDCDEAIRIGRAALRMVDRTGYRLWALHRLLPLMAQAYLVKEDVEGLKAMGRRLREDSAAIGHLPGLAWARACDALGTLLEEGRRAEGIELLEAAIQSLEDIPLVGDATLLREVKARHLAELGDKKGALEDLTRAYEAYLRMGAAPEAERVRAIFPKLGARSPRRAGPEDPVLSSREAEVAQLVAERMSNKAIARELGISPRTVSTHLSHIFQRLGIGSRGELADYIRREGHRSAGGSWPT
jgi:DNA-binding CsgD family transcriptional regulator